MESSGEVPSSRLPTARVLITVSPVRQRAAEAQIKMRHIAPFHCRLADSDLLETITAWSHPLLESHHQTVRSQNCSRTNLRA